MTRVSAIAACLVLIAGPALAQDGDAARAQMQQMNDSAPGQAEATGATQIGATPATSLTTGPAIPRDRALGGSAPSRPDPAPPTQVTTERGRTDIGAQLTAATPTAEASPSPATRAQGRVTATATPTGPDRCDPQARRALPVACDRVIEARANEFSTPDHQPLSAEQRLLATQRELRAPSNDLGSAARRLANGQVDDSNAALAVASMALQRPSTPDEDEETPDTSATDAIVAGIVNMMTGAPPSTP